MTAKNINRSFLILIAAATVLPWIAGFRHGVPDYGLVDSHLIVANALYIKQCVMQGAFPTWSPFGGLGTPTWASAFGLYPFFAALWIISDPQKAFLLVMLVHALAGAIALYFWLKSEGLSPAAAAGGAIAFSLSIPIGGAFLQGSLDISIVTSLLPVLGWSVVSACRTGHSRHLGYAALILALLLLSARLVHLPFFFFVFTALFLLIEGRTLRENRRRFALLFFVGLLGVMMAAVYLLPAGLLARESLRVSGVDAKASNIWSLEPRLLVLFVLPEFWQKTIEHFYIPFAGVGALLLALIGVPTAIRNTTGRIFLATFIFSFAAAFGSDFPVYGWFVAPIFGFLRGPMRMLLLGPVCLGGLTAFGIQELVQSVQSRSSERIRAVLFLIAALCLLTVAATPLWQPLLQQRYEEKYGNVEGLAYAGRMRDGITAGLARGGFTILLIGIAASTRMSAIAPLAIGFELVTFWISIMPAPHPIFPHQTIAVLDQAVGGRSTVGGTLPPRILLTGGRRSPLLPADLIYGGWECPLIISSLFTPDQTRALSMLYTSEEEMHRWRWDQLAELIAGFANTPARRLNMSGLSELAIDYIIVSPGDIPALSMRPVATLSGGDAVYAVPDAPRRFSWLVSPGLLNSAQISDRDVTITPQGFQIKVRPEGGRLLVRYAYSDAWLAAGDGKSFAVHEDQNGLMTCDVPPNHKALSLLSLSYQPRGLAAGMIISGCGFLLVVTLVFGWKLELLKRVFNRLQ